MAKAMFSGDVGARKRRRWSQAPRRRARLGAVALLGGLSVAASVVTSGAAHAEEGLASPALQAALSAAATVPASRIDLVALDRPASDCVTGGAGTRAEVSRPIDGSSRVAVKLTGSRPHGGDCTVWAWARVRVFAQVSVAARAIRPGEALPRAVRTEEREILPGHIPAVVTEGALAERAVGAGQMIETTSVRAPGARAGEMVKVLILTGALAVEQIGRAVPCGRTSSCAVLPSGKHVEGTFADGRLLVSLP